MAALPGSDKGSAHRAIAGADVATIMTAINAAANMRPADAFISLVRTTHTNGNWNGFRSRYAWQGVERRGRQSPDYFVDRLAAEFNGLKSAAIELLRAERDKLLIAAEMLPAEIILTGTKLRLEPSSPKTTMGGRCPLTAVREFS
jgi:hypothetical protein